MQQRQDRGWAGQGLASDHGTKASALGCRQKMLRMGRQSSFFFRWRRRARSSICDERSPMTAGLVIFIAAAVRICQAHIWRYLLQNPDKHPRSTGDTRLAAAGEFRMQG